MTLFSSLDQSKLKLPKDVVARLRTIQTQWDQNPETLEISDEDILDLTNDLLPFADQESTLALILELTAVNVTAAQVLETPSIAAKIFPVAKEFLRNKNYSAGNKAIIWDYAFSAYRHEMAAIKSDEDLFNFLQSDELLLNDPFLTPSLLNYRIGQRENDRDFLKAVQEAFGHFPSVSKKLEKLLRDRIE